MKNIFLIITSLALSLMVRNGSFVKNNASAPRSIDTYALLNASPIDMETNGLPTEKPTTIDHREKKSFKKDPVTSRKNQRKTKLNAKTGITNQTAAALHKKLSAGHQSTAKQTALFALNAAEIGSIDDFNKTLKIADKLIFDATLRVSVSGNTDNTGSEAYNDQLSQERAENIRTYLVELGVKPEQIILSFNGMDTPIADNETEAGRTENRRVEMIVFSGS